MVLKYNVEIKPALDSTSERLLPKNKCDSSRLQTIPTARKPEIIPANERTEELLRVVSICENTFKEEVYEIPLSRIKRITTQSTPTKPPATIYQSRDNGLKTSSDIRNAVESLSVIEPCCRNRTGLGPFHKVEFRLFAGYRGLQDSIFYPTQSGSGGTLYKSSFYSTERGGSTLALGVEAVGLWNVRALDESGRLQLGVMTGVLPIDGSIFIPIAIHPRYTFQPSSFDDKCDTWYIFGDVGIPVDFQTRAPLFGTSMASQRLLYGLGIGHDWALNCTSDISIDAGFRAMNLPLPELDCCPGTLERNPYRFSTVIYLRFGVTF